MQTNNQNSDQESTGSRRSRWGMRGLNFPPFSSRSRSTDSKDCDERKEKREAGRKRMQNKMSFWKRKSANITDYDPTYRVIYLGNVLTGWAKGDGCVDKPLSTLWRNHIGSDKPDIIMKLTVVNSGLRAVTKEHGLTEYWANRITYSVAHPSYPRVFCWIYRHEGRKMKQELRCHAVLCPREDKAKEMACNLQNRLHQALVDFKKEKISRQNARLSLANSIHDNPSMPYRKLLLQAGTCNYKPPIERSKSAPKLTSIEEAEFEEDEEDEYDDEELHHHDHVLVHDPIKFRLRQLEEEEEEERGSGHLEDTGPPRVPPLPGAASLYLAEESDEDEITDYLGVVGSAGAGGGASVVGGNKEDEGVDSAQSSSPASQGRSTGSIHESASVTPLGEPDCNSLSSDDDQSDPGGAEGLEQGLGKMKVNQDQDAISDESGYSEEPISGRDVTVVRVNGEPSTTIPSLSQTAIPDSSSSTSTLAVNTEHKLNIHLNPAEDRLRQFPSSSGGSITITTHSIPVSANSSDACPRPSSSRHNSADSFLSASPRDDDDNDVCVCSHHHSEEDNSLSPSSEASSMTPTPSCQEDDSPSRSQPSPVKTSPRLTDLSVKSVLLSEFSASDRIKYIERSSIIPGKSTLVLNRQEFCINI